MARMGPQDLPSQIARGALLLLALASTACEGFRSFPEKAKLRGRAVYAALELTGRARMESGDLTLGKTQNPSVDLQSELNVADRDTGVGATIAYGDGFSGLEFSFLRWEQRAFDTDGVLDSGFGDLQSGDSVESDILLEQWRLEYLVEVLETPISEKGKARLALGAGVHHNNMRFEALGVEAAAGRAQNLKMRDAGMPMLRGRAEAELRPFKARIDAGYSEGHWRNIDGRVLDLQLSLRYSVSRDLTAFVGWRQYDLPFEGGRNDRDYEFDAELSGWVFGLELRF